MSTCTKCSNKGYTAEWANDDPGVFSKLRKTCECVEGKNYRLRAMLQSGSESVVVGRIDRREVTPENRELLLKAYEIMTAGDKYGYRGKGCSRMGKMELGDLIDYIEKTYGLEKL
mgnify:CR=1 FL=1